MGNGPNFIIIGAMKCATSTLHDQLAAQNGIFMTTPKEPYYFSDDAVYSKGASWYAGLFRDAREGELCGESSTHYTKLPTYPETVARMVKADTGFRLIYMMRHPIERLISQYIHEWRMNVIKEPLDSAVHQYPMLREYSMYSYQLRPFMEAFGPTRILPVFFERFVAEPDGELERVCRFIGFSGNPEWKEDLSERNVSSRLMRQSPMRDAIVNMPVLRTIRRRLVPQGLRDKVKDLWRMNKKPVLSDENLAWLESLFDEDLARLGDWLGTPLDCGNFKSTIRGNEINWRQGLAFDESVSPSKGE